MTKSQIKIFGERLKRVAEGFETMKNFGIDEDILIAWLCQKTKLSQADVRLMLRSQEDFYTKLISKDILNGLKRDNEDGSVRP